MSKEIPDKVKTFVRALLLSSPKGVKQTQFLREYEIYANAECEWRKMGFNDPYEFLLAIPDVARLEYSKKDAQNLIFGVNKKDIYTSSHAKKAGSMGTGVKGRPPSEWDKRPTSTSPNKNDKKRTVNVSPGNSSVKVTDENVKGLLQANEQGLFGVHIRDLPKDCSKEDLEMVFKEYHSLRLCKIIQNQPGRNHPFAFAKFSNQDDAARALKEKNGYRLREAVLKLSKATEQSAPKQTLVTGKKSGSTQKSTTSPPKSPLVKDVLPQNNSHVQVNDVLSEIELGQLYSRYGVVKNVIMLPDRSAAALSFSSPEEAVNTMRNMKEFVFNGQVLSISNQVKNCITVQIGSQQLGNSFNAAHKCLIGNCSSSLSSQSSFDRSATSSSLNQNLSNCFHSSSAASQCVNFGRTKSVSQGNNLYPNQQHHQHPQPQQQQLQQQSLQHQPLQQSQQYPFQHQRQGQTQQHHPPQQQLQQQKRQQQVQDQHLQHLHQQQQHPEQKQEQPQFRPSIPNNLPHNTSHQALEKDIHLILNREEMEKLCSNSGHPLEHRWKDLPDEVDILVTEVVDACRFWAIIDSKTGNWQELGQLEKHLQKTSGKNTIVPQRFALGAGKFTENDSWYRCFVLDVSSDCRHVKVIYSDYGNVEWIPLERFSSLESIHLSLPPQANAFHLAGLEVNYNPDSMKEGAQYLKQLIGDRTLRAKRKTPAVVNSNQLHILEVELFNKDLLSQSVNDVMAATSFVSKMEVVPKLPSSSVIPNKIVQTSTNRETFKLKISWVQSASHIFYHEMGAEDQLKKINTLLNKIPVSERVFPKRNELVCFMDHTRKRVKILDTQSHGGAITAARVKCVDYGHIIHNAPAKSMLKLPDLLATLPPVAKEAFLLNTKVPSSMSAWPRNASQVMLTYRDQVIDGIVFPDDTSNKQMIELYNANGECLNKLVMQAVHFNGKNSQSAVSSSEDSDHTGILRKELGTQPLSASSLSIISGSQGLPSLQPLHYNPSINTIGHSTANKKDTQGTGSRFYMPPPPIDSKDNQRNPSLNIYHQAQQYISPQETQGNSSQWAQNSIHQGAIQQNNQKHLPQASYGITSAPQGVQKAGVLPHMPHNAGVSSQGTQNSQRLPPPGAQHSQQCIQLTNNPPQSVQSSWSPQETPSLCRLPQGAQAVAVNGIALSSLAENKAKQPTQSHVANPPALTPKAQIMKNSLNVSPQKDAQSQQNEIKEQWGKERETLLKKRKEQEEWIEGLSRPTVPKHPTQNLQELKEKLAKQVRIKELENKLIKLKKEIEALEGEKANLQYHLLDN